MSIIAEELNAYKQAAEKDGILSTAPSPKKRSLVANPQFIDVSELPDDEEHLRDAQEHFRQLAADRNPFHYISKYEFAERMLSEDPPLELLLRFLTDRSFYFEQYRSLGNLPGDLKRPPAPSISSLLEADHILSPAALIEKGLERVQNERKANLSVPEDKQWYTAEDKQWNEIAEEIYQERVVTQPHVVIPAEDLINVFLQRCKRKGVPEPDEQTVERLFGGYHYWVENNRLTKVVLDKEWIPTTLHRKFYAESTQNYKNLLHEIQRRKEDMQNSSILIDELNLLAWRLSCIPNYGEENFEELPQQVQKKLPQVVNIFEVYARSQFRTSRKTVFFPILSQQKFDEEGTGVTWKKPYVKSICRLLAACWMDRSWHVLTPLFLYQAFTQNSRAVMENTGIKLVQKIRTASKSAKIRSMASQTGYSAGINFVLYQGLQNMFPSPSHCFLAKRERPTPKKQDNTEQDNAEQEKTEVGIYYFPFERSCTDWNDFGFYLITGYGSLYHHAGSGSIGKQTTAHENAPELNDDILIVSYDELSKGRKASLEDAGEELPEGDFLSDKPASKERVYKVYRYMFNLNHPVGKLEDLLEHHIRNCIPNRPRDLTPTSPNTYRWDSLHPPYEELANFLLQDMHQPAMQRIVRIVKKLLTEHPEHVEEYRIFMRYPWATGHIKYWLQQVIHDHRLYEQITKFSDYSTSGISYNVRDSIQAILEYEIRAQLIGEITDKLRKFVYERIDHDLFAYLPLFEDAESDN